MNPVNANFSQYSAGRLTTAQYGCQVAQISEGDSTGQPSQPTWTEMYSYHPAGGVTAKRLVYEGHYYDQYQLEDTGTGGLEADYTFDSYGRVSSLVNPANPIQYQTGTDNYGNPTYSLCTLTFTYDAMGRPSGVGNSPGDYPEYGCPGPWVQNVQYDFAGRQTSAQYMNSQNVLEYPSYPWYYTETRSYNASGQLATIGWPANYYGISQIQYAYPATQNNGQVTQEADSYGYNGGAGTATTSYQYDALKRLTSAAMTQTGSTGVTPWTQTYQYDGFGNLTQKVLNGTATPIPVNAATNRLTNAYYDANGNMTSGAGGTFTYDEANRIASVTETSGGQETFTYAPDNKRVFRQLPSGEQEITFYGGRGEKLGVFEVGGASVVCTYQGGTTCTNTFSFVPEGMALSFNGRKVQDVASYNQYYSPVTTPVSSDRVGSNGKGFYPYGDQSSPTIYDGEMFATYNRDGYSGLDYADQRFYASSYGRFNTADRKGGKRSDPGSLNKYSYVRGDPVNRNDPKGLCDAVVGGITESSSNNSISGFASQIGAISAFPYAGTQIGLPSQQCD